ncbi:SRPBCC family protein [Sphingobacterium sp. UDSM-2020]|uniref:SRPBCC family protein n=1 Tax=Sphingobacterium sp. UDSM-2020 TaxID=2795738 RepID=UPI0019354521|nr:SRPBCC family protein [Sphingobacterium sp. UDSM-2020]QQD15544.1 SRPBCC family protein [Sphingobacterium sp. UDSM-2020]
MIYLLQSEQQLNCDIETAWNFFSSPHNLTKITPQDMNFVIVNKVPDKPIYDGMIIDYKITPLLGITTKWRTKITRVKHHISFTDQQLKGPYKRWNHFHEFIVNEKGVLMKDIVHYELPYGFIGRLVHTLVIRKKLYAIFNYRYLVLEKIFNSEKQS